MHINRKPPPYHKSKSISALRQIGWLFSFEPSRVAVLIFVAIPSLDFQQIILTSAVRANMDDSGAQDMCIPVLDLAGTSTRVTIMANVS